MESLEQASNVALMPDLTGKNALDTGLLTQWIEPPPPVRTLKIETHGDPWKGLIKPKIRLIGRWLERSGFAPGNRVSVTCVAPGVIELRSAEAPLTMNETIRGPRERPLRETPKAKTPDRGTDDPF